LKKKKRRTNVKANGAKSIDPEQEGSFGGKRKEKIEGRFFRLLHKKKGGDDHSSLTTSRKKKGGNRKKKKMEKALKLEKNGKYGCRVRTPARHSKEEITSAFSKCGRGEEGEEGRWCELAGSSIRRRNSARGEKGVCFWSSFSNEKEKREGKKKKRKKTLAL